MEIVKDMTPTDNNTATAAEETPVKEITKELLDANADITEQDLANLKIVVDWAVQAIGSNRQRLQELLVFENELTKKLRNLIKKQPLLKNNL